MSSSRRIRSRLRWLSSVVLAVAAVVLVGASLAAYEGYPVPFLERWTKGARAAQARAGKVAVPLSALPIAAYTRITRDHLWNARTQQLAITHIDQSQVNPGMLVEFNRIIGRVLDHDKPAGYVFTEDDFLPLGTRPGLVAGIPPGQRAVRVDADRIQGIFGLRAGDRFDLVSTLPMDPKAMSNPGFKGVFAAQMDMQSRLLNVQKQATVRVIVQSGMVVSPVTIRQAPTSSRSLTQGTRVQTRPVQEVVIAVAPSEVALFTEALAVGAEIMAVPRSGHPDDPPDSRTPNLSPRTLFGEGAGLPSSFTVVETISGVRRELAAVPRRP